jgi:hypothetical protein
LNGPRPGIVTSAVSGEGLAHWEGIFTRGLNVAT